ncbi:hypothetical protein L226DRAFT_112942 [Lentinus tigrinus ALCF2SS1-7]|uniref:uncharacterized protein n=1 Tax=Lentinus tigrinus ALCF2SS1-7 TaxID=1328758 RepID=UPI0011662C34|nr:hypothetical protein L226DRAFT_112942 [Lentinus tigrinus ALCF2SS1-7]
MGKYPPVLRACRTPKLHIFPDKFWPERWLPYEDARPFGQSLFTTRPRACIALWLRCELRSIHSSRGEIDRCDAALEGTKVVALLHNACSSLESTSSRMFAPYGGQWDVRYSRLFSLRTSLTGLSYAGAHGLHLHLVG